MQILSAATFVVAIAVSRAAGVALTRRSGAGVSCKIKYGGGSLHFANLSTIPNANNGSLVWEYYQTNGIDIVPAQDPNPPIQYAILECVADGWHTPTDSNTVYGQVKVPPYDANQCLTVSQGEEHGYSFTNCSTSVDEALPRQWFAATSVPAGYGKPAYITVGLRGSPEDSTNEYNLPYAYLGTRTGDTNIYATADGEKMNSLVYFDPVTSN